MEVYYTVGLKRRQSRQTASKSVASVLCARREGEREGAWCCEAIKVRRLLYRASVLNDVRPVRLYNGVNYMWPTYINAVYIQYSSRSRLLQVYAVIMHNTYESGLFGCCTPVIMEATTLWGVNAEGWRAKKEKIPKWNEREKAKNERDAIEIYMRWV